MTLSEFKAWFEGFTEAMDGPPGPKAWERIKARVAKIKAEPTTIREIYRDWPWWPHKYALYSASAAAIPLDASLQCSGADNMIALPTTSTPAAMFADIGRQEAQQLVDAAG